MNYNDAADAALNGFYAKTGAETTGQKINCLSLALNGERHFYATGGNLSESNMVGCLEHEYLSSLGLIELQLA